MFPEILRDDVVRLETRRLWLRWPTQVDTADVAALLVQDDQADAADVWVRSDAAAAQRIGRWRAEAEAGTALHWVMAEQGRAIGIIHLTADTDGSAELSYRLRSDRWGRGLMAEAVQIALDTIFLVGDVTRVEAAARCASDAGYRVLDRCGFQRAGAAMTAPRSAPVTSGRHVLDRKTWLSTRSRLPMREWPRPESDFDKPASTIAGPFTSCA